jgi:hypothetical protein
MAKTAYRVNLHIDARDGAGVYVRSPELPGLHLVGEKFLAMKPMIEQAIKRLFKDNHQTDVEVVWINDMGFFAEEKEEEPEKTKQKEIAVYKLAA